MRTLSIKEGSRSSLYILGRWQNRLTTTLSLVIEIGNKTFDKIFSYKLRDNLDKARTDDLGRQTVVRWW